MECILNFHGRNFFFYLLNIIEIVLLDIFMKENYSIIIKITDISLCSIKQRLDFYYN